MSENAGSDLKPVNQQESCGLNESLKLDEDFANEADRSNRRERLKQRILTGEGIDRNPEVFASSRPTR